VDVTRFALPQAVWTTVREVAQEHVRALATSHAGMHVLLNVQKHADITAMELAMECVVIHVAGVVRLLVKIQINNNNREIV